MEVRAQMRPPIIRGDQVLQSDCSERRVAFLYDAEPWSSIRSMAARLAVLALLLLALPAMAADPAPPAGARGRLVRVHDGDTYDALFDGRRLKVRLANADTPETGAPGSVNVARCPEEKEVGDRAPAYVRELISTHEVFAVSAGRLDKYQRVLGNVVVAPAVDGHTDLGAILVYQGLGRSYRGERRMTWCPER